MNDKPSVSSDVLLHVITQHPVGFHSVFSQQRKVKVWPIGHSFTHTTLVQYSVDKHIHFNYVTDFMHENFFITFTK
jgi:hypothetical protein